MYILHLLPNYYCPSTGEFVHYVTPSKYQEPAPVIGQFPISYISGRAPRRAALVACPAFFFPLLYSRIPGPWFPWFIHLCHPDSAVSLGLKTRLPAWPVFIQVPQVGERVMEPTTSTDLLTGSDLKPPGPSEAVYREDCTQCFDSIVCLSLLHFP